MLAWSIFTHSLRQVFGNLNGALRVSGVLYLVMMLTQYILIGDLFLDQEKMQAAMMAGTLPWGKIAVWFAVCLICWLWIVVGWHRFVLLNEAPGLVPIFHGQNMATYFGKSLLMMLILIPVLIVAGVVAGLLIMAPMAMMFGNGGPPNMALVAVMGLVAAVLYITPAIVVSFRLSPMLPAAALGQPMKLGAAWAKTKGHTLTMLALAAICMVPLLMIMVVNIVVAHQPLLALVFAFVVTWFQTIIGASIATTIYGYFVEGRKLVA